MKLSLLFFFLVSAIGCDWSGYERSEKTFDAKSFRMVEEKTELTFPAGSRGLNFYYRRAIDPAFHAKIEIPATAHEAFENQIAHIKNQDSYHLGESEIEKKLAWWNPDIKTVQVQRIYFNSGGPVQLRLCKEGDRWILYAQWFTI
jgi:hypothetical protein